MRSLTLRTILGVSGVALVTLLTACNPLNNTRPGPPESSGNVAAPEWFSCGVGPNGLAVKAYGMNDDSGVCGRAIEAAWAYFYQYPDGWNRPGQQVPVVTRTAGTWDCGQISEDPVPYQECALRGSPVDVMRLLS